ncbi:MAG TPA: xylulokinase [Solirubrobacteraceae bacterium]|nr:xylulokinase [Solirubrobacteraceae bacterium]
MARLIGLDVGTSSAKGLAIDERGRVLAEAERGYPVSMPRSGWSEQDPEQWWLASRAVLDELDAAGADGIGLTGQMHGLVALDAQRQPLRPAILWNDGRSQEQADEITRRLGTERLVALGGNLVLAGFTAPKLRWMAVHEPDLFARIAHVLLPKDYVRMRLCDVLCTDVSDASGTSVFDVAARTWSDELADAFGVQRSWLPSAVESGAVSGHAFGGVPVAAGAGDQAAGALGVGVTDGEGPASVVLGTSGVVFAARDTYAADPAGRLHAFCHALPDRWHVMAVILSAAGSLSWLARTLGGDQQIGTLLQEAARWEPGAEGLTFAPYLAGERTPHADADVRGGFVGLGLRHDRGALVRAVLEGVAHALADGLDLIAATGPRPPSARISGGGARSELWCRIVASVLDLPLQRTVSTAGSAFGAALLGGVAAGVFESSHAAAAATVSVASEIEPDPAWVERYAAQCERFRALYPALSALPAGAG